MGRLSPKPALHTEELASADAHLLNEGVGLRFNEIASACDSMTVDKADRLQAASFVPLIARSPNDALFQEFNKV